MTSSAWFQKISIPFPWRLIGNVQFGGGRGEGGIFNAKHFGGKYEPKMEFPEGRRGSNQYIQCWGSMSIFWNSTIIIIGLLTLFFFQIIL